MNKVKMVRNIKENNKKDSFERENGWNNRFNTAEKSPLIKPHQTDIPTVIKPTNLRQASSKLKIKTESPHLRIKSAGKSKTSTKSLSSVSSSNHHLQTVNNILTKDAAYNQITTLWDSLGVTGTYCRIFDNVSIQLASIYREGYFSNELSQLQKTFDLLIGLKKDISSRQKIIELMKKFEQYIALNSHMQSYQLPDKVLNDIISTIKDLRLVSIRIVNQFIKIRKNMSYDVLCGKFDIDKIKDYNKTYLITMKNDIDFLSTTNLSNYFSFASESDPFLTSLSETVTKANSKYTQVPIDDDMVESIKNCQYVLLREMINYESSKLFPKLEASVSTPSIKANRKTMNTSANEIFLTHQKPSLQKIRIGTKSPEYNRMNKGNHKEYIIAGKIAPLKYEDSKLAEKDSKRNVNSGNAHDYMTYIGKTQAKECLEAEDLMKIDEIINRSIKQKRDSEDKHAEVKTPKKESIEEIRKIIDKEQNGDLKQNSQERIMKGSHEIKANAVNGNKPQEDNLPSNENEDFADSFMDNQLSLSDYKEQGKGSNHNHKAEDIEDFIENNTSKIVQCEYDGYSFKFFNGTINELSSLYTSYITQVDEDQIAAFNLSPTIDAYLQGVFPKILLIYPIDSPKSLQGLITLAYDHLSQSVLKLNITSISSIDNSKLHPLLLSFLKYSNDNLAYDEMHIEFFYALRDGQFHLNKSIEDLLKSKAKFKWVNMENDGRIRKINYKFTNPALMLSKASLVRESAMGRDIIVNCLRIRSCSLISLEMKDNSKPVEEGVIVKGENEVNDFALICLFGEMISRYDYSVDFGLLNGMKFDKLRKLSKDFMLTQIGSGSEIGDFIQSNLHSVFNRINPSMLNEYFICGSLMKMDSTFENIASTVVNGFVYNQLNLRNIEVFSLKKEDSLDNEDDEARNEQFYLIHTTNENCSMLVYEIVPNGSFSDLLTNNSNGGNDLRIFQAFKNVYYKIDQKPNETKNIIYLPSFSITKDNYLIQPRNFANVAIRNEDSSYRLGKLNQFDAFSLGGDSLDGLIGFNVNEDDIFIQNDFIIAVINHDLLCDLQIPTIAAYIVRRENWTKR